MTTQQPEALRLAWLLELAPEDGVEPQTTEDAAAELRRQHARIAELEAQLEAIGAGGVAPLIGQQTRDSFTAADMATAAEEGYRDGAAELRRLHAYCQELEAQVILDCMTHIQNPAENEHVAGDVSKNGAELNMSAQQEAQEPCPTCAALARTVMLDQVSFDRKPDCYGIRQITDDEGVEEWEDIRTSPDVAREEANDMMATGRGEIYEVVPLWTTPKPSPAAQEGKSHE